MTQAEKREYLITELLKELPEYESIKIPTNQMEQKKLLRSLFNIRMPLPVSDEFIQVQDEYLRQETGRKGITSLEDLEPIEPDIYLWQGDITTLQCDAIVNAANSQMLGCFCPCHGCIDNAIHTFAGVQLRLKCAEIMKKQGHKEETGRAKITPAYNLPCKYVLHTVGPIVKGSLTQQYTVDFLSKKRVKNNGIVPQYYVENSHEPIIPRELFMQVQEEMVRRANLRGRKGGKKRVYSSKYALSSIVYCGHCGDIYRRVHWNNRGYKSIVWRCVSRLEEKGSECTAPTINEETLQTAVVKAINELLANKEPFLSTLQKNIATVFNEENDNATDDIDGKLEELQQQLLIQAKSKNDYEDVADEIYRLRELKQNALAENAEREGKRQRIAEMTDFLNEQSCELEEYDEQLVRRLIEKVTVFDDKLTVEFKSGVEIDIEI